MDSLFSCEIYQGGQLHGLDRPEGCILPGTYSLGITEVPVLCLPELNLPIQDSLFRSIDSPLGIHQSLYSHLILGTQPSNLTIMLSGQLADSGILQGSASQTLEQVAFLGIRLC